MLDNANPHGQRLRGATCLDTRAAGAFAQGDLSGGALDAVVRHLDGCMRCHDLVTAVMLGRRPASVPAHPDGLLAGRYRISNLLGSGGMGTVFQAVDTVLGEVVALKMLTKSDLHASKAFDQLKSEVALARRVNHPHVCRVFDLWVHEPGPGKAPQPILVMEHLTGGSLADWIARGPLDHGAVETVVRQVLAGLGAAHQAGVIHRDLKSDNVLFRCSPGARPDVGRFDPDQLQAVVTDFGLARAYELDRGETTTQGGFVGTAAYMAPEQITGGALTPATDLYALGVMTYEALTGSLPFLGRTLWETAALRFDRPPPKPSRIRPDIPARWDVILAALMATDPAGRPANSQQALALLDRSIEPVPAVRAKRRPPNGKWLARRWDARLLSGHTAVWIAILVSAVIALSGWATFRNATAMTSAAVKSLEVPNLDQTRMVERSVAPGASATFPTSSKSKEKASAFKAVIRAHDAPGAAPSGPAADHAATDTLHVGLVSKPRGDLRGVGHPREHRETSRTADAQTAASSEAKIETSPLDPADFDGLLDPFD